MEDPAGPTDLGWVTRSEFAAVLGVSVRTVDELASRGVIEKNRFKEIDLAAGLTRYFKNLADKATERGVGTAEQDGVDPTLATAMLAKEKTLLARRRNADRLADLVPAESIGAALAGIVSCAEARFDDLRQRVADLLERAGRTKRDRQAADAEIVSTMAGLRKMPAYTLMMIKQEADEDGADEE